MFNRIFHKYYTDNVELNLGSGGKTIATDDIGGIQHELVKVEFGTDGNATMVSSGNPLPVTDAVAEAALASIAAEDFATSANQVTQISGLASILAKLSSDPATQTTLAAILAKIIAAPATEAKQDVGNASLSTIAGKDFATQTTLASILAKIITAPATEAKQDTIITALNSIDAGTAAALGQALMAASVPVVIASDQSAIPVTLTPSGTQDVNITKILGTAVGLANGLPVINGEQVDFTGTFTNATQTNNVVATNLDGYGNVLISINGTYATATAVFEGSDDSGTTWYSLQAARDNINVIENGYTSLTNTNQSWQINNPGFDSIRVRSTAVASGTVNVRLSASAAPGAAGATVAVATPDNTILYNNTISATGAITGFNTTSYQSVIIQLTGTWSGNLIIEGSNDDSNYNTLLVLNCNEFLMQDVISEIGNYQLKTSTKFARINVKQLQIGNIVALVLGRTVEAINASDVLSLAMDKNNNTPLYVSEIDTKKDASKALIPSDAPAPIYATANGIGIVLFLVDTTGYQSVTVQPILIGSNITIQTSNDAVNWTSLLGYTSSVTAPTGTINTASLYSFSSIGRFVRGVMVSNGLTNAIIYLRQQAANPFTASFGAQVNLSAISGTSPVTSGVAGMLAVGGNIAVGSAPTSNPLPITIDTSGLTRRLLTDLSGRISTSGTDAASTARPIGVLPPAAGNQNVAPTAVNDISQFEGQSLSEILGQILVELKINNQMMSELPLVLQGQNGRFDEPAQFRNDQTIFAN